MSSYTTFAIAGAGNVGIPIIENLLSLNKTVIVLSRSAETSITGTTTRLVDYSNPSTIESALQGVDVVIAAFGAMGAGAQYPLAVAAKKVGVKLFVPAEYGMKTEGLTGEDVHPVVRGRAKFQEALKELDLPYLLVYAGPFAEMVLAPFAPSGRDLPNGKFAFVGKGDTKIVWSTRKDLSYFLAHALVETPDSQLAGSTLRFQSDIKSFNEIVSIWEDKVKPGSKVEVTRMSMEDAQKVVDAQVAPAAIFAWLFMAYEKGESLYDVKSDSERWPEYKAMSLEDVLKTFV